MRENYVKNGRENDKFIVRLCGYEEKNKGRWRARWIVILRLRLVRRWKGKGGKDEETKYWKMNVKMNSDIKVEVSGEMKR